jgi:hypothetical protein
MPPLDSQASSSYRRRECLSVHGLRVVLNPTATDALNHPYANQDRKGEPVLLWVEEPSQALVALHLRYARRAVAAYSGRNRNVFVLGQRLVVKLPRSLEGYADNDWEGSVSNAPESLNHPEHVQYPKTRLAYVDGIPVVFMERIEALTGRAIEARFGQEPDWVASVDGGQVGVNRHGRLVAYDYGLR